MKYLETYNQIFEFNRKDIQTLLSSGINDNFTVSFEFELECDDPKIAEIKSEDEIIMKFKSELLTRLREDTDIDLETYSTYITDIINSIDFDNDVDEILDNLEPSDKETKKKDVNKNIIMTYLYTIVSDYFENEDDEEEYEDEGIHFEGLEYMEEKVEEHLPNLYKKYGKELKYEFDSSLLRGVEFSFKNYITKLTEGITMLDIFFEDFNKQDYFFMNERTSIHINLGYIDEDTEFNALKGVVMLSDVSKSDVPFVFKDMTWRMNNHFCGSIVTALKSMKVDWNKIDIHDIKNTEKFFNKKFEKLIEIYGAKAFGVNLSRLFNDGYAEFRYVGGKVNKDLMIDKLLYFAFITYLMASDYKDKEYQKKLYKFIEELKGK